MGISRHKKWREENPEAARAHTKVQVAIESGKIKRGSCRICGSPKAHAHHKDYSLPLNIIWLCSYHHRRLHTLQHGDTLGGKKYIKKGPSPKKPILFSKATELRAAGLSYKNIGIALGISIGTAYKWLNKVDYA